MALHLGILGSTGLKTCRHFSTTSVAAVVSRVTVIGGGTMGGGIAQVAAAAGNQVNLVDMNDQILQKSKATIEKSLGRVAKKLCKDDAVKGEQYVKQAVANLQYMTMSNLEGAVKDADLVVEAIIEDLAPKQDLFEKLDKMAPAKTIFASNTSSIPIIEIAARTSRKDRFGGLHFFSPVPVMRLLEVIRISETSEATYQDMEAWGKAIGKVTVRCKDTPGFIVNRLLIPYTAEAVAMVERGDATPKDIDTAMKLGAGYPVGPFELSDSVGVDVGHYIIQGWHKRFPDNPLYKPSELVTKMVKEGKLGQKTGEGWYKYNK